jgi:hypothetical protein
MGLSGYKLINNRYKNIFTLINNMSVNTPPTENIPIFDASVFPSASGTALTIATGQKYFLSYPVAQGSEIFPQNITLQSTLTDASGDVGTAGQILSSTGTGTNWINNSSGINAYVELDTSTFPSTLPIPTTANTYVYITGSTGGTLTIPTTGVITGTLINFRNFTLFTINIAGSTYLPYSSISTTASSPYVLSAGCSATFYYNGSIWVQPNLDRTMQNLIVQNTCYAAGLATDSINLASGHSGTAVNVYNSLTDADLNIANTLPSPYTVRIANTASGASGGSVHCSNIGFDGSNINNAITPAVGTIKLGNSLTSGPLYIAGGSTSATHTTGPIIIGSDSTATGGINIGTGTNLTVPTVNTVNIGSGTYTTNIKGTTTATGLITASAGITSNGNVSITGANTLSTVSGTISTTSGNISTTSGNISAGLSITAGTGITASSGNITASSGSVSASTTITAGTGITATSGNITASSGSITTTSGSITSAGVITGTSVVSPSFNASGDTTTVGISTTQTSGTLNIGTGSRTTGGTINIGTGSGATANPINIGGAGTITTFTNGLSLSSDKYITTGHSTSISGPSSQTQVGYTITPSGGGSISTTVPGNGLVSSIQSISLSTGVWILTATRNINNTNGCSRVNFSFGDTLRSGGPTGNSGDYKWGVLTLVPNGQLNYMTLTGIVSALVPTTVYFNLYLEYSSPTPSITSNANINFNAVRIA